MEFRQTFYPSVYFATYMEIDYSMTAERGRSYTAIDTFISATKDSSVKNAHIQFTKQSENTSGFILFNYVQIIHRRTPHQHLKSFPTIKNITLAGLTLAFVFIPYSYFKILTLWQKTGKKMQKLPPFFPT